MARERIDEQAFQQWAESIMAHGVENGIEARRFAAHALAVLEEYQASKHGPGLYEQKARAFHYMLYKGPLNQEMARQLEIRDIGTVLQMLHKEGHVLEKTRRGWKIAGGVLDELINGHEDRTDV